MIVAPALRVLGDVMRTFDTDYDEWEAGDYVVWEDEQDGTPLLVVEVDEYQQVWFIDEEGKSGMTRATNMLRVKD